MPTEPHAPSVRPSIWGTNERIPLAVLAALGLVASLFGRLLAPALFGAATGLELWIGLTQLIANYASQVVAAAGVVFALWSVGVTLSRVSLGIAYRMVMIPATIATSALTIAAFGRVLEPELGSALAICAITATAAATPLVLLLPSSRAIGLALALTALSGAFDFAGVRLSAEAVERGSPGLYRVSAGLTTLGFVLEVLLVVLAFGWLAQRRRGRAILLASLSAALALLLVWALRATSTASASTFEIVVARSLASLLRAPAPFVPPSARLMLEAASFIGAVAALFATRKAPFAPVLALCLIARGSLDIPIPALLLVVAAIALPAYGAIPLSLLPNEMVPSSRGERPLSQRGPELSHRGDESRVDNDQVGHRSEEDAARPARASHPAGPHDGEREEREPGG
jgi:hypothetical protein